MTERIIYQATKEEVVNEQMRLLRLERELDCGEQADFILDRQEELHEELVERIERGDESRLKRLRKELQRKNP